MRGLEARPELATPGREVVTKEPSTTVNT